MKAYERLLKYAAVDTQSSEDAQGTPSTPGQLRLCALLAEEMRAIGLQKVYEDGRGYVYGYPPASAGMENEPTIGFIAHVDTAPDFSGTGVKPVLHENYDGGDVTLGTSGLVLSPEKFPDLKDCIGQTLITTDGTTLLGADDKAGVAEIVALCAEITADETIRHGALSICFTPDEEIGCGADHFDFERFNADFAYTVDGGEIGGIECENFNAAAADITVHGINTHPGTAKNKMKNAALYLAEFVNMLPVWETPQHTEGREGFYHLARIAGNESEASAHLIIRDHDKSLFERRKEFVADIVDFLNKKYGEGTFELNIKDSYYNMLEIIKDHMDIVDRAEKAMRDAGVVPEIVPIRGGTDGSRLSFEGLPCPNLSTGGINFHSIYEAIPVYALSKMVEVLKNIVSVS